MVWSRRTKNKLFRQLDFISLFATRCAMGLALILQSSVIIKIERERRGRGRERYGRECVEGI